MKELRYVERHLILEFVCTKHETCEKKTSSSQISSTSPLFKGSNYWLHADTFKWRRCLGLIVLYVFEMFEVQRLGLRV